MNLIQQAGSKIFSLAYFFYKILLRNVVVLAGERKVTSFFETFYKLMRVID